MQRPMLLRAAALLSAPLPRRRAPPPRMLSTAPAPPPPPPHNPGVTRAHFRALLEPPPHPPRRLRWDWHLRNFLTALVPPAVLYLFLKWAAIQFGGDEVIHAKLSEIGAPVQPQTPADDTRTPAPLTLVEAVEIRLADLERQMAELRQAHPRPAQQDTSPNGPTHPISVRGPVERARDIAKTLRRAAPS